MGYIYKDSPDWRDRASQSFNDSFSRSLEGAVLRKQKKKDEAEALAKQIALAGLQEVPAMPLGPNLPTAPGQLPTPNPMDNYTDVINIGGKTYAKPLGTNDIRKRDLEMKVLEQKSKEVPIYIQGADGMIQQVNVPEGFTGKGAKVVSAPKPTSDLGERKFQFEKDKQSAKQAEIDKANKAKSDAFTNSAVDALKTIDQVRKGIKYFGAESLIPTIPGTELADWRASYNKLTAGKILDVLANMKNQSRTGATGFGQLNAGELKVITDASTELRQEISEKRAAELLNEMQTAFQKIVDRESQQPANTPNTPTETISEEDIQHTMSLHPEYTREQILQLIGGGQ